MDLPLDEIIKKKFKKNVPGRRNQRDTRNRPPIKGGGGINNKKPNALTTGGGGGILKKLNPTANPPATPLLLDARMKIIARQRNTIRDAREKLNALHKRSDARLKINSNLAGSGLTSGGRLTSTGLGRLGLLGRSGALNGNSLPRRTINNSSRYPKPAMDTYQYEGPPRLGGGVRGGGLSLRELQKHRLYSLGGTTSGGGGGAPRGFESDYLMELEEQGQRASNWDPASVPQLEVRLTRGGGPPSPQHLGPAGGGPVYSGGSRGREQLRGRAEQEIWPPTHKPSILRREESVKSRLEPMRQEEGYRIVVSNLQPSVTHEDIKELFEDIGPLLGSRVVRPGTAEVVYRDLKDAVAAVDTYHNRQLDGQPMKCLLVKPPSSGSKGIGTKGSVIPDISTIHKALFLK